jgi:hypothetical protein
MAKRKTFNVSELVDSVNGMLKGSAPDRADVRQGAMNVLEHILHETGNYSGFRYLLNTECDGNPGVNYDERGLPNADYEARFANTDKTRVCYF